MVQILRREMGRMLTSVLLVFPLIAAQPQADRTASIPQAIQQLKADKPPRIDGTLNDPVWQRASRFKDFKTLHPSPGKAPSEPTEVYLTYDRENIYAGFRMFDSEPAKIRSQATERDNPGNDDWIAFCLDSRNDELSAIFFLVTPSGLQADGTLDANGSPNTAFDMQWSSAARRTADGWTAEIAVPFKRLPFPWNEQVVMGFKVARFISRKSEEADFPEIVPGRAPHLAQFQKIQFSAIQPSLISDDVPLVDIREIYKRRLRLRTRPGMETYEGRVREWGDASVLDYLVFPSRELKAAGKAFHFDEKPQESRVPQVFERLEYFPGKRVENLEAFLRKTETASFIVIKNDTILYEKYFNGYERDSIVTSFSVAKSFASTLVGIAIDEGRIGSVSDPITKYIPELGKRDARFTRITIRDLLLMSSGVRYEEDAPYYDNRITYLEPDLRKAALEKTQIVDIPGKYWLYNNYHPLLIGMILERVTGKTVAEYLQEKLWSPLGMEYPGSWSIDSEKDSFEKMESGINARAIDFAKFGRLFLNQGHWQGKQIVSEAWVEQATQPEEKPSSYYQDDPFFVAQGHYYKYFWWGSKRPTGRNDFYGAGNKGQYVYVSPQKNLIIVRNGIDFGLPSAQWVRLFYDFASTM
jgi:CubicO group peptidase (beta-lactamase class C family)